MAAWLKKVVHFYATHVRLVKHEIDCPCTEVSGVDRYRTVAVDAVEGLTSKLGLLPAELINPSTALTATDSLSSSDAPG